MSLEILLLFFIAMTFILHVKIDEIDTWCIYNFSPILFSALSLRSIYKITFAWKLGDILFFIEHDETGMGFFVGLFLANYVFCILLMFYNFYKINKSLPRRY